LSLTDIGGTEPRARANNTGIKKKYVSKQFVIVDATQCIGEAMATKMNQMADASRELENEKIEFQLKLFAEQLDYQRKRSMILQQTTRIANDNVRLAIDKQFGVVHCLSSHLGGLASIMSFGLI